jgi:GNAT superfamily N-acetyltransferase
MSSNPHLAIGTDDVKGHVSEFRIQPASERDVPVVLRMINALAEYEKLADQVVATEASLREALFGQRRFGEVIIGYAGDEPVGFALFFHNFSTFRGAPGLYLEDLFVEPRWRGRGFGRKLLQHLAGVAVARGCHRMEWAVLDWNESAIQFYRRAGARSLDDWRIFRLTGDPLNQLAAGAQ